VTASRAALALSSILLAGCAYDRALKITEIGPGRVELYLDEDPNQVLALHGQTLAWRATDPAGVNPPVDGQIDLIGEIRGGRFLIVFEDANYSGGPARSSYANFFNQSVEAIVVQGGALPLVDPARAYAYRVSGRNVLYVFPFFFAYHDADDTVRFGPSPRPNLGGDFTEDQSLVNVTLTEAVGIARGQTLRRHTATVNNVERPADRNLEGDWRDDDESYGTLD
jgi:hypothetical protein